MSEIPAYGTPTDPDNGFVTHRETAERIWDTARAEARAAYDEERQVAREREAQWRRLVEVLEGPKTAPGRAAEITRLKEYLGL